MSETKRTRNTTAGRTPAKKNGTGRTTRSKKKNTRNPIMDEVIVLLMGLISVILLLSNFNLAGDFGKGIAYAMFGLFGIVEYIMPVLFFVLVMFVVANKDNHIARIKAIAGSVTVMLICTFIQLFYYKSIPASYSMAKIFTECADRRVGGGFFGAVFYKLFSPFGIVASFFIVIVFIIIGIVIVTERSFISGVKKGGSKVYNTAKDDFESYREESAKRAEIREEERIRKAKDRESKREAQEKEKELENALRREKKTRGVTTNTKLVENTAISEQEEYDQDGIEIVVPVDDDTINDVKPSDLKEIKVVEEEVKPAPKKKPSLEEVKVTVDSIEEQIHREEDKKEGSYVFPPLSLLAKDTSTKSGNAQDELKATSMKLAQILQNFGVKATVTNATKGPSVTRYELTPEQGVKVSRIVSLADDIKLNLAATDIRIEAPIPGKAAVGIEVPNREKTSVMFRELVESPAFKKNSSNICFGVGKDIGGNVVIADIAKMPHLLIAGSTGSGKSVCINTIIMSILYKANPNDVKLIMIDPKVVELKIYNEIPHLLIPVVTDCKKAAGALNWAVAEMDKRYKMFADVSVRDLKGYNEKVESIKDVEGSDKPQKLPQIVIVVDEVAELMMVAQNEVEGAIVRLAQLARAAGIHLVIATQRPTVNVITGLIKANVPSKIAFAVASGTDSRTIIDRNGAEKLLGRGDMLYFPSEYPNPVRLQGAYVTDKEVSDVVEFIKKNANPVKYNEHVEAHIEAPSMNDSQAFGGERDLYFEQAGRFIIEKGKGSIGMIQRMYKVGFNRAARIMDQLTEAGVVGPEEGTKPRKILMSIEEFEQIL